MYNFLKYKNQVKSCLKRIDKFYKLSLRYCGTVETGLK